MAIQHIYLMVRQAQVAAMVEWYSKALAPLDYKVMFRASEALVALGPKGGWPNFWIRGHDGDVTVPTHVCFQTFSEFRDPTSYNYLTGRARKKCCG